MPTIMSTSQTLRIECVFVDGDTRNIVLKNPKPTIESSQVSDLNTFMQTNNVIIGDKDAGTFGRIKKAVRITETKRIFTPAT